MDSLGSARWFEIRPAQNRKPTTYRCPLCGERLPALRPHALLLPEGQAAGRRHAHLECVRAAQAAGRLPSRAEWRRGEREAHGERPSAGRSPWWRRIADTLRGRVE